MASSDNLASLEPWAFRPTFNDAWFPEAYARDTETLTKALQISLFNSVAGASSTDNSPTFSVSETITSDSINPFVALLNSDTTAPPTPTASNLSASDPESAAAQSKRQRSTGIPGASGKVSKRKSRASKRSQTTFITADPANFRQMVQQVTGIRFCNSQVPVVPVLKPEPQRPGGGRLPVGGGCLPTLDTSAFLLDHHHQQQVVVGSNSSSGSGPVVGSGPITFSQPILADGGGAGAGAGGLDFDTFANFPTLDSWK